MLHGNVIEIGEGRAIKGAEVRVFQPDRSIICTHTDEKGQFKVSTSCKGEILVRVGAEGYYNQTIHKDHGHRAGDDWAIGTVGLVKRWTNPATGEDFAESMSRTLTYTIDKCIWAWEPGCSIPIYVPSKIPAPVYFAIDRAIQGINKEVPHFRIVESRPESGISIELMRTEPHGSPVRLGKCVFNEVSETGPIQGIIYLNPTLLPHVIARVASHELGHAVGFRDVDGIRSAMNPVDVELPTTITTEELTCALTAGASLRTRDLEAALSTLNRAHVLACMLCDQEGQAAALLQAGMVYRLRGDLDLAKVCLEEAMRLSWQPQMVSAALNSLGLIAMNESDLETAYALLEKSAGVDRAIGNDQGWIASVGNQAEVLMRWDRVEDAVVSLTDVLEKARQLDESEGYEEIAVTLNMLGYALFKKGLEDQAIQMLERALSRAILSGNNVYAATSARNLADIAWKRGDKAGLIKYLEMSAASYKSARQKKEAVDNYELLFWECRAACDQRKAHQAIIAWWQLLKSEDYDIQVHFWLTYHDFLNEQTLGIQGLQSVQDRLRLFKENMNPQTWQIANERLQKWKTWLEDNRRPAKSM